MRELTVGTHKIAGLSLVTGRGEVMEPAQELALVPSDELEDEDEVTRGGHVLAAFEVRLRTPERGSDAGLGRRPLELFTFHGWIVSRSDQPPGGGEKSASVSLVV